MIKHSKDESGHSGLFIVETKNHKEMEFYLTILKTCQGYDGDILAKLWFFVRSNKHYQIPGDIYLHYYDYEEPYNSNIKVIHFCNDLKPWLEPEHFHFHPNNYYAWLYLKFLNELEKKYNFDFL